MSLGADNTICRTEFVEAMRARLIADDPGSGANVDQPAIQANLGALGLAVYRIATVHAETASDTATDAAFWQWVADVQSWLAALSAWQTSVAQAFAAWAPASLPEQTLRTALTAIPSLGAPPPLAPVALRGRIR